MRYLFGGVAFGFTMAAIFFGYTNAPDNQLGTSIYSAIFFWVLAWIAFILEDL